MGLSPSRTKWVFRAFSLLALSASALSCQGIELGTGGGFVADTLVVSSSELTYVAQAAPDTSYAASPTISVSGGVMSAGALTQVRYGLVPLPPCTSPCVSPGPNDFVRSARLQFDAAPLACSNIPPELEIRRAPLGTNATTQTESRFNFMNKADPILSGPEAA